MPEVSNQDLETKDIQNQEEENKTTQEVFVDFKDPKTGEVVKIPKKVQIAFGHASEFARRDIEGKSDKKLKELTTLISEKDMTLEKIHAKLAELEDEKLTQEERGKKERERERELASKTLKDAEEKAEKFAGRFREYKIDNDLLNSLSSYSLNNAEQTLLVLKAIGKPFIKEDEDGNYHTRVKLTFDGLEEELDPKEAVSKFLAQLENDHHLKISMKPGSGTSASGGRRTSDGRIAYTQTDLSDPAKRREHFKLMKEGKDISLVA